MHARTVLLLLCPLLFGCSVNANDALTVHRSIPYESIPNVSSNLTSLDIYTANPASSVHVPVVVWVHGGGWAIGDKANQMQVKPTLFTSAGYCLVSINYRLSPRSASPDPKRIMYPVHEQDVAAAIAWVHAHISEYGGDSGRIALMGHSAGAHLVSIVSTDESFLKALHLPLNAIRGTVSLDTAGDDIPAVMAFHYTDIYANAFGTDPSVWKQASPLYHVAPGKGIPPFLVVTRGIPARRAQSAKFVKALQDAGVQADLVDAGGYTHNQVNSKLGAPGETVVTPPVMKFLAQLFETSPTAPAGGPGPSGL